MRRLWRYNSRLYVAGTGSGVSILAMIYLFGYKTCFESPMHVRLTKNAIRNGEITGYYDVLREKPRPKNQLAVHMI